MAMDPDFVLRKALGGKSSISRKKLSNTKFFEAPYCAVLP